MNALLKPFSENKSFNNIINSIKNNITPVMATGVIDSQKTHLIYYINQCLERQSLIITNSELKAKEIYNDLKFFLKEDVMFYPSKDIIFYSADVKSIDIIKERFEVINRLLNGDKITLVLSIEALFDKLVPKNIFKDYIIDINSGDNISIEELSTKLMFMGYERTELVEGQGQFALRGGIMDLYSTISENAVRIEFWGDEIDSIRILDSFSQRSVEQTESIRIFPVRELVYGEAELEKAVKNLKVRFNEAEKRYIKSGHIEEAENLKDTINEAVEKLQEQKSFSGVDKYIQFFYDKCESLFDYMQSDALIYYDEAPRISEHAKNVLEEFKDSMQNRILKGYMLPEQADIVYNYDQILNRSKDFSQVLLSSIIYNIKDFIVKESVNFKVKSSSTFKNNFEMLVDNIKYFVENNYKILFLAGPRMRCERIARELNNRDITSFFTDNLNMLEMKEKIVYLARGSLNKGFEYISEKFVVITDKEVFGEEKKKHKTKKKKNGLKIENFSDLKVGDYVVHDNHGVGVFKGVEKIVSEGISKDYIKIGYADGGNLYVAINQMDMVQKYIGGEANLPKLNKLGGTQWVKAKAKAKKAAYILAQDLVDLYAQRQASKGFVYSADTIWQKEFEDSFAYDETDDQLNAIIDVKTDMESSRIMDRLICGDVGFGKTEIAIRAAFKAIQDGKQVAYLVPTTILAQQHYTTFLQRMKDFPVTVEMMSRFRTPKEQKTVIEGLKNGTVDIVIGTHRILSKDLVFKDLGMIIVDEEQRFGVSHKEKLKSMKQNIDVLTLTATPIPRTLHMSLTGIRDMSILEEPPSERLPIQTYVMEYNEEFVKDAIHRELARGGQVYFLHNRVRNIAEVASRIQKLVPESIVGYAHGQMSERELENIMMDFMENNINVLVCTTIIETGLDIPNVNTIIIQDADCMGLSQLYQLRGRVGRSNRNSYAYLMYKKDKVLQEVSEKRLQTIKEFTEFGSGFKIAMRDLEIRGAGNLLGAQQHGHMDSVGYEMYCKLLDQAVRELRGEEFKEDFETLIDVNINAFIPLSYIKNEEQKLEMYKKISIINNIDDFYDVQEELEDRFGTMPASVQNLLDISIMKAYAHKLDIVSIIQKQNNVVITFKKDAQADPSKLMESVKINKNKLYFTSAQSGSYLTYKISENEDKFIENIKNIFESIL